MEFKVACVDSFIISFSSTISLDTSSKVKYYFQKIQEFDNIIEIVPSYTTILVTFDIFNTSFNQLQEKIKDIKFELNENKINSKLLEIPVYYDLEVGLDLERISEYKNISIEDIIKIHSSKIYNVFAIGFAPGFAYLGEVDEKIAMKRLTTPRKNILKGSVAIADTQTAVYPQNSPAGWNVIGKTTFEMFDKKLKDLTPLSMGDKVQFKQISKSEFLDTGGII